jgi:hypothetical protein
MSRLGFWVAWSVHYNQLLEQLFPTVLSEFPVAQRQAEFTRLRTRLFFSRNPSSTLPEGVQSGINPLDAPTGIPCLRLIPPNSLGGLQLRREVRVPTRPFF